MLVHYVLEKHPLLNDLFLVFMKVPYTYKYENKCILNIVDFTGCYQFKAFMPSYLRDADAAIFVCSYDLENSISVLRDRFENFFKEVSHAAFFFVVNKSDLYKSERLLEESQIEIFLKELLLSYFCSKW